MPSPRFHRWLKVAVIAAAGLVGAAQLVPYGWRHPNPPVTQNAPWPSAEAEALARDSCYECHSNETQWPPYSYVAPMSWLVRRDVEAGREALNFSTWDQGEQEAHEGAEQIREGSMPPATYRLIHRSARLSDDEAQVLIDALEAMDPSHSGGDGGEDGGGGGNSGGNSGPGGG